MLGSGETSASGRRVFDWLLRQLSPPVRVAIIETPAGFQPNSALVAQKVADFLRRHLANYALETVVVPARRRDTAFSPDDPALAEVILGVDCLFLGPGSPTYAVRQLRHSVVWDALRSRFAAGVPLVLASAAVLAISAFTLPVYEIYKAGADLGWQSGLDLLGGAGAPIVFVPHWNNREGGAELDTSHCFVGAERFAELRRLLPAGIALVGIDEHTALILKPTEGTGLVIGAGEVIIERSGLTRRYGNGEGFPLPELADFDWDRFVDRLPADLWQRATAVRRAASDASPSEIPAEVLELIRRREAARREHAWGVADDLRDEVTRRGYRIQDTPAGPKVERRDPA